MYYSLNGVDTVHGLFGSDRSPRSRHTKCVLNGNYSSLAYNRIQMVRYDTFFIDEIILMEQYVICCRLKMQTEMHLY